MQFGHTTQTLSTVECYAATKNKCFKKSHSTSQNWKVPGAVRAAQKTDITAPLSSVFIRWERPRLPLLCQKHNNNNGFLRHSATTRFQARHLQTWLLVNGLEHIFSVYQKRTLLGWMHMLTTSLARSSITQTRANTVPFTLLHTHTHMDTERSPPSSQFKYSKQ